MPAICDLEGLPEGYTGVCVFMEANSVVNHPLLGVSLDSRDLKVPQDEGSLWIHIWPVKAESTIVAVAAFGIGVKQVVCDSVEVDGGHRGKGIALSLYLFVQELTGRPIMPSSDLSDQGRAFWQRVRDRLAAAHEHCQG